LRNLHRPYTTERPSFRGSMASHITAGLCGGLIVLAGGYSYYHFSGLKKIVDAARSFSVYLAGESKASSNVALAYLRKSAQSYVASVPGAGLLVDSAFDWVDEAYDAHQEEASVITQRAYDEIQSIVRNGGNSQQIGVKVAEALRKYLVDLHALCMKAGGIAISPMWDKYSAAKEKLDGAFDEMERLAAQGGPNIKRIFDDAQQQVNNILSTKLSYDALPWARNAIREKTREVESSDSDKPLS